MLTLTGELMAALQQGGGRKRDGSIQPVSNLVQVQVQDGRGRFQMVDLFVDDLGAYEARVGQTVRVPVRAWASEGRIRFQVDGPLETVAGTAGRPAAQPARAVP